MEYTSTFARAHAGNVSLVDEQYQPESSLISAAPAPVSVRASASTDTNINHNKARQVHENERLVSPNDEQDYLMNLLNGDMQQFYSCLQASGADDDSGRNSMPTSAPNLTWENWSVREDTSEIAGPSNLSDVYHTRSSNNSPCVFERRDSLLTSATSSHTSPSSASLSPTNAIANSVGDRVAMQPNPAIFVPMHELSSCLTTSEYVSPSSSNGKRTKKRGRQEQDEGANVPVSAQGPKRKKREVTSKYQGVCWYKRTGKWVCQVKVNGTRVHVGYFKCEHAAGAAYNEKLRKLMKKQQKKEAGGECKARKRTINILPQEF